MITKQEKDSVSAVLKSPHWGVVEQLAYKIADNIRQEGTVRDTQWETVKATLIKEGQADGVTRLIKELYKLIESDA